MHKEDLSQQLGGKLKKGCLLVIATIVVASVTAFLLTRGYAETSYVITATAAAGPFILIGWGLLGRTSRNIHKRKLLSPASLDSPPRSSGMIAIQGTLVARDQPLKSPFHGRECVAYQYDVFTEGTSNQSANDSRRMRLIHYSGMHLAPATIRSPWGDVRLLAMPNLDALDYAGGTPEAGHAFLAATHFEQTEKNLENLRGMAQQLMDVLTDDDGCVAKDWCYRTPKDPERLHFLERILPLGAEVIVTGEYDALQRAFVPSAKQMLAVQPGTAAENRPGWITIAISFLLGLTIFALILGAVAFPRIPTSMIQDVPVGSVAIQYRMERLESAINAADHDEIKRFASLGVPEADAGSVLWHSTDQEIQALLVKSGIPADAHNSDGITLLMEARSTELASMLLDHGADPNAADVNGNTALISALMEGRAEIARLLLKAGADTSHTNRGGLTPIEIARRYERIDDPELLALLETK